MSHWQRWLTGCTVAVLGCWLWIGALTAIQAPAADTVRASAENVFLIPAPVANVVRIVDQFTLRNASGLAQDFVMTLPAGAEHAAIVSPDGIRASVVNGRLISHGLLRAGSATQVSVTFSMPFDAQQGRQITLHADYPVDRAKLFIPIGDTALSAEGLLTTTETVSIEGTQFRAFTRLGIPAGEDWDVSLQMLPTVTSADPVAGMKVIGVSSAGAGNTLQAVGNLLLAAFILFVGLTSIRATQWGTRRKAMKTPQDALLDAWMTVERQYETGALDKATYQRRRSDIKRKLDGLLHSVPPESHGRQEGPKC